MALLNFKYGAQADLKSTFAAGTVYITSDTKKLFVDNPHGTSGRICLGDFQLVSWTKSADVTSPAAALASYSLKDANTLYITVESKEGATAMWRYNGTTFVAISNSEEIADIVADIAEINTALEGKAPTNHAVNANTYGLGSNAVYGHVKLTDAIDTTQANGQASTGLAASAYAVKLAYDRGDKGVSDAASAAQAASNAAGAAAQAAQAASDAASAAASANTNAESRLPKVSPTLTSGQLTLAEETPTADKHAASKKYVDTQDAATLQSAKNYTDTAKTAILGEADYAGTVKGAYDAASSASSAASTAQGRADDAYELAGSKTTTAEVKAQIEAYGYATTTVAQEKADAALVSAKSYTDGKIGDVNTTIDTLKSDIGNLSNIMNFLGTTTSEIVDGTTTSINKPSAVEDTEYVAKTGDVVVDSKGKECVYDGNKWYVIGDTSANSTAITALQGRMTTAEDEIDTLQADVGTNDGNGALFARVSALETWKGTHATEYSNLNTTVGNHTAAIGASTDDANASGSLYARIKKNASDISGHETRISTLENWKTSHANEYTALAGRVTTLETWQGTHTTAFNELSATVSGNSTAINNLTTVLTWGTF